MDDERTRRVSIDLGAEAAEKAGRRLNQRLADSVVEVEREERSAEFRSEGVGLLRASEERSGLLRPALLEEIEHRTIRREELLAAGIREVTERDYHRALTRKWESMEQQRRLKEILEDKESMVLEKESVIESIRARTSRRLSRQLEDGERFRRIFEEVAFDAARTAERRCAIRRVRAEEDRERSRRILSGVYAEAASDAVRREGVRAVADETERERNRQMFDLVLCRMESRVDELVSRRFAREEFEKEKNRRVSGRTFEIAAEAGRRRASLAEVRVLVEDERKRLVEDFDELRGVAEGVMKVIERELIAKSTKLERERLRREAIDLMERERLRRVLEDERLDEEAARERKESRSLAIEAGEQERYRRMLVDAALDAALTASSKENLRLTKELEEEERYRRVGRDAAENAAASADQRRVRREVREAEEEERQLRVESGYTRPSGGFFKSVFLQ